MTQLTVSEQIKDERYALITLQEKSTKDAAAVKVLTIISLIYLPTTIVAVSLIYLMNRTPCLTILRTFSLPSLYTRLIEVTWLYPPTPGFLPQLQSR